MKDRYLKYLNVLSQKKYMTSKTLSQEIGYSEKTIRNDIKDINKYLENNGARIESKIGSGYLLNIYNESIYFSFINQKNKKVILESKEERIQFLLQYMFANNDKHIHLETLADLIYVSRSTLISLLKDIKKIISQYNLELASSKQGIKIVGDEMNLRICIAENLLQKDNDFFNENKHVLECLEKIVTNIVNNDYQMSDFSFQNLLIHLFVSIKRMKNNIFISPLNINDISKIQEYPEYVYALKLSKALEKEFCIDFPESEVCYIAIHLAAKRLLEKDILINQKNIVVTNEIHQLVNDVLEFIYDTYQLDFRNNFELFMALCLHFVTLNVRLKYNLFQKNPMLLNIQKNCQLAYVLALSIDHLIYDYFHRHLTHDEIAYIALHFNLALEKKERFIQKKNILLVCATGLGSSEFLKFQFLNKFSDYINKADACDLLKIKSMNLNDYHYVFTTVPLIEQIDIPVIYINMFLNDDEIKNIKQTLMTSHIDITTFFDESLFFDHLSGETKEEVIQNMICKIRDKKVIEDSLYQEIMMRENLSVTEFGKGVAFPHPCHPCSQKTFVAIGILDKAIIWDTRKVQFIYMLILGKEKETKDKMQEFYERTANLLTNEEKIKRIIKNRNYSYFLKNLLEV